MTKDITAPVIQLQNGDVFLTGCGNNGSLDNLDVQNIELLSPVARPRRSRLPLMSRALACRHNRGNRRRNTAC